MKYLLIISILIGAPSVAQNKSKKKLDLYTNIDVWQEIVSAEGYQRLAFQFVQANPDLPNVLIMGNSISIGYTPHVRKILEDKANVYRIPANGGDTQKMLDNNKLWLGNIKWDIIHFNWGLHDLKYVKKENTTTKEQNIPPQQYKANLEKIIQILIQTDANLIWANTSYIPEEAAKRTRGDEVKYNNIALEVINKYPQIDIDDQYTLTKQHPEEQKPQNVHFLEAGQKRQAQQVAKHINKIITKNINK